MGPVTNLSRTLLISVPLSSSASVSLVINAQKPHFPSFLPFSPPPSSLWGLSGEEIEKAKRGRGEIEGEAWIYVVWFLRFIVSRCQKYPSFRSASLRLLCHRWYCLLALSLLPSPHATEARGIEEDGFDAIYKVRSHLAFCFLEMFSGEIWETPVDRRFLGVLLAGLVLE